MKPAYEKAVPVKYETREDRGGKQKGKEDAPCRTKK